MVSLVEELLACQSPHHAPLSARKVGGGGAINHQFRRAQAPLGDAQGNITQLLEQNFYLLFFSKLAGQQHSYPGRGTCTSSLSSRTGRDVSLTSGQTEGSSASTSTHTQSLRKF